MAELEQLDPALASSLRLALTSGVGPRLRSALLERFGTAQQVLAAAPADLRGVDGIGPKLAQRIAVAHDEIDVEALLQLCREHDISITTSDADRYPKPLLEIPDPPPVLFQQGTLQRCDELAIAIVGSRHATQYGKAQAERLAGSLARMGFTIVSGLARGIDAAAHRGALSAGGRTLAVLGSGLLNIYPSEHRELALEVRQSGALMSENPPHTPPLSGAFPQRNRIITGLSLGVIVVEASLHSGALISARHAMEQGREVFAVPGRVDSRMSHGCHRLLRDGARLVETADDVIEELGPLALPTESAEGLVVHHPAELLLNEVEQQILNAITAEAVSIDAVVGQTGLPIQQILSTLSVLEMRHLVRRVSGNLVCRP